MIAVNTRRGGEVSLSWTNFSVMRWGINSQTASMRGLQRADKLDGWNTESLSIYTSTSPRRTAAKQQPDPQLDPRGRLKIRSQQSSTDSSLSASFLFWSLIQVLSHTHSGLCLTLTHIFLPSPEPHVSRLIWFVTIRSLCTQNVRRYTRQAQQPEQKTRLSVTTLKGQREAGCLRLTTLLHSSERPRAECSRLVILH